MKLSWNSRRHPRCWCEIWQLVHLPILYTNKCCSDPANPDWDLEGIESTEVCARCRRFSAGRKEVGIVELLGWFLSFLAKKKPQEVGSSYKSAYSCGRYRCRFFSNMEDSITQTPSHWQPVHEYNLECCPWPEQHPDSSLLQGRRGYQLPYYKNEGCGLQYRKQNY